MEIDWKGIARSGRLISGGQDENNIPAWYALMAYQPGGGAEREPGWAGDLNFLARSIDYLVDWATEDDGQLVVNLDLKPGFPFDPATGKAVFRKEVETRWVSAATGYHKKKAELPTPRSNYVYTRMPTSRDALLPG